MVIDIPNAINSIFIIALPLILVAIAGVYAERSGIINIALEGIMVVGATTGFLLTYLLKDWSFPNSSFIGAQVTVFLIVIITAIVGGLYASLLSFAAIKLKANQTIIGTALNILPPAIGFCICFSLIIINGTPSTTINLAKWVQITPESLGITSNDWWVRLIVNHLYLTVPLIIILIVVMTILLYKTRFGLRLRSCGENPHAADSVGINVSKMRYVGGAISGALGAIGGLQYAFFSGSQFLPEAGVSGYGFLALALMIFGNWQPIKICFVSILFSFFIFFSSQQIILIDWFPFLQNIKGISYILKMIPYVLTTIVLITTSKNSRAPKAEGIPYDKGQRS